jgi:large subunit ribosomal protein L17
MRHLIQNRKLGRTSEHRLALRRGLAQSLFEHGQIVTTLPKAKDVRPFVERLVTLAKKAHAGDLPARRRLEKLMNDRGLIAADHREDYELMSDAGRHKTKRARSGRRYRTGEAKAGLKFTAESVVHRLIDSVAPRYLERPGGYTRIIKLARRRIGDNSQRAILQLVGDEQKPGHVTKPKKTARQKRIERLYAAAARVGKSAKTRERPKEKATAPEPEAAPETPVEEAAAEERPGDQG